MAYRPTNNIQENIIHRNTVFDSQGMVACCTCGYCIEKNEDATLTLTNFKAADPLVNENSIGSTIIEFSDYMIPVGSFEYSLTPYKYPVYVSSLQDESLISDNKFATGLAYYPFLRCDGVQTTPIISTYGSSLNPVKDNIQYGSSFSYVSYYYYYYGYPYGNSLVAPNPELSDNNASMYFVNIGSNIYSQYNDSVAYDSIEFGSFAYSYPSYGYSYSNTDITLSYFNPTICSYFSYPPDTVSANSCPNQSDFYKWGRDPSSYYYYFATNSYLMKATLTYALEHGFYLNYNYYNYYNYFMFPRVVNLDFASELSYNLINVLESGPTSSFVAQLNIFQYNTYNGGFFNYGDGEHFLPLSDFQTGGNGGNFYVYNEETGLNESRTTWLEPNPNDASIPQSPPCTEQQLLDNINQIIPVSNLDAQSFLVPKSIPLATADIGSAQEYFDYIDSHDYSQRGFKANAGCANGIVKVMEPVFFADFDDYSFSFIHPDYTMEQKSFYMTDKFLVPDRTSWSDCQITYSRATTNDPWIPSYPSEPLAKTVEFQTINSLSNVYKKGYVLDRFQLGNDGSFLSTLSIVKESPFYSVGLESNYRITRSPQFLYTGVGASSHCAYYNAGVSDNVSRYYMYWWSLYSNANNYSSPLLYKGEFIPDAIPLQFFEYENQDVINSYTNGYFSGHNSIFPFVYYEDACQGFMNKSYVGALYQYVAQKTERTRTTSRTDSSGWTTMLIENVLWIGKTLLTETYYNENSPYILNGGVTKITPVYTNQNYYYTPTVVSISAPTGPNPIQATAIPIMSGQILTGVTITNPGSGYITIPTATVAGIYNINFVVEIEDNRNFLANGQRIPASYNATLKGGFESDIEVGFQSVAICKNQNIVDRMKRVSQVKVTFENYEKIPQVNTLIYDYQQSFIDATPETPDGYFNYNSYSYMSDALANIAFAPPSINEDEPIFLRVKTGAYEILKQFDEIDPPVSKSLTFSPGRVYPDFGVPDRFKSCLLINGDADVWATGNEVKFGSSATVYYSIYMEEIKDEKQTAGQSLIRIATTLQDANDGVYIPNVGLAYPYSGKSLTVTFLYGWEDSARTNAPQYEEEFDPNGLDFSNFNADKIGASASEVGEFTVNTSGLIDIYGSSNFPVPSFYWQGIYYFGYDRLEVISLSPLIIKYVGTRFLSQSSKTYTISDLVTPDNITVPDFSASRKYGFMCDMIVEEVVDEFIEEALPVEFNQILENVEFIQTSNLMNSKMPMQMINPEQCEHIGKVIDRKDCNCPKKWVRLCDVHGKTDWKKCMQCKDFKVSE